MWVVRNKNEIIYNSELRHYGVLGMHWGVRKDDYDEDYMAQAVYARNRGLNDISVDDWISRVKDGDDRHYGMWNIPANDNEVNIFDQIGTSTFFNASSWNSASQRQRDAAHDYVSTLGCKLMNGTLRGSINDDDIRRDHNEATVRAVHDSIDMFSGLLSKIQTDHEAITCRKTNTSGLAGLLGIDENDLSNPNVLNSLIGSRVQDPGYFSTTLIANAKNVGSGYGDVKVFTHVPEGSQAMYMEPASTLGTQKRNMYEVCLQRDSIFEIGGISLSPDKSRVEAIMLDLIGQG